MTIHNPPQKSKPLLGADECRRLLDYDPQTGVVRWRVHRRRYRAGSVIGYINHDGYRATRIYRRNYRVHRLIYLYMTGVWPDGQIDHINGDRADNRWVNLRVATRSQNNMNGHRVPKHNSSGHRGVVWKKDRHKWQAWIGKDGRQVHIGTFDNKQDAIAARKQAEKAFYKEYAPQGAPDG